MAFCLLLIPFMPTLWTTALLVLAFYFAYYLYEPPYRGLYPDVLPPSTYGRAQGVQHVLRGIALGDRARRRQLPASRSGARAVPDGGVRHDGRVRRDDRARARGRRTRARVRGRSRVRQAELAIFWDDGDVRRFLIANSAWEGTFAAARSFVILYVDRRAARVEDGLRRDPGRGGRRLRGGGDLLGAARRPVRARAGDLLRLVRLRDGVLVGGLAQHWHELVPRADRRGLDRRRHCDDARVGLLYKIVPAQHRGAVSGLATTTKGIGLLVGAPLAGLAIDLVAAVPRRDRRLPDPLADLRAADPGAIPLLVRLMAVEDERGRAPVPATPPSLP